MSIFRFTILLLFIGFDSSAQNCTTSTLLQQTGIWKEGMKGSQGGTAIELAKEKKLITSIHAMIKSGYTPIGVVANYLGVYDRFYPNMTGNIFYYRIIPLNYYCEGGQLKIADETSTYFQIAANMFDSEIYDTAQGDRLLMEGFNVMYDLPIQKDGYWLFEEKDVTLGFGIKGKRTMWLITYDGKLPYAYVTKKEFLLKRKNALLLQMKMSAESSKDFLKNNEIEKKYMEVEYKNDPAKLEKYMRTGYLQNKTKYEKMLAENELQYQSAFRKIDAALKMPEASLNEPAIIKNDPHDALSYLFTNSDDPFRKILIKPNPGYFNNKVPKSTPQFFWVNVIWNHQEPIASKFRADIIQAVDFSSLKNMLGKDLQQPIKK